MRREYKIHPAIGVARLGNSTTDYLLGAEAPGVHPPAPYRDGEGRIKRTGARFRVYEYSCGHDGRLAGVREITSAQARIEWRVHLANRKAAADGFPPGAALRNADIADRSRLVIDAGSQVIAGRNQRVELSGAFLETPVALGTLLTDEAGRLIVLGGFGTSRSVPPGEPIGHFANNDRWCDDTADGSVTATICLRRVAQPPSPPPLPPPPPPPPGLGRGRRVRARLPVQPARPRLEPRPAAFRSDADVRRRGGGRLRLAAGSDQRTSPGCRRLATADRSRPAAFPVVGEHHGGCVGSCRGRGQTARRPARGRGPADRPGPLVPWGGRQQARGFEPAGRGHRDRLVVCRALARRPLGGGVPDRPRPDRGRGAARSGAARSKRRPIQGAGLPRWGRGRPPSRFVPPTARGSSPSPVGTGWRSARRQRLSTRLPRAGSPMPSNPACAPAMSWIGPWPAILRPSTNTPPTCSVSGRRIWASVQRSTVVSGAGAMPASGTAAPHGSGANGPADTRFARGPRQRAPPRREMAGTRSRASGAHEERRTLPTPRVRPTVEHARHVARQAKLIP